MAISNRRFLSIEVGRVSVEYKDYADGSEVKAMTLTATKFIRRFLLHILPGGFVRIRQFGFLANRERGKKLALCRALPGALAVSAKAPLIERKVDEPQPKFCPACGIGHLILVRLPLAASPHSHPLRSDSS